MVRAQNVKTAWVWYDKSKLVGFADYREATICGSSGLSVFSREAATDSSCGRQPAAYSSTPFIAAKRRQIIEGVSPLVGHKHKMLR